MCQRNRQRRKQDGRRVSRDRREGGREGGREGTLIFSLRALRSFATSAGVRLEEANQGSFIKSFTCMKGWKTRKAEYRRKEGGREGGREDVRWGVWPGWV